MLGAAFALDDASGRAMKADREGAEAPNLQDFAAQYADTLGLGSAVRMREWGISPILAAREYGDFGVRLPSVSVPYRGRYRRSTQRCSAPTLRQPSRPMTARMSLLRKGEAHES